MPEAPRSALRLSWIGIVLQFGGLARELTVAKNRSFNSPTSVSSEIL